MTSLPPQDPNHLPHIPSNANMNPMMPPALQYEEESKEEDSRITESIEEGREGNVWIRMSKVLSVVTFAVSLIFPPIAIITGIIALILIVVPLLDRKTSDSTGMILAIVALVWSFVVNAVIVTIVLVVAYNGLKQL